MFDNRKDSQGREVKKLTTTECHSRTDVPFHAKTPLWLMINIL